MSKITLLPEELSNRIAAGEVVERPASVVKELFENSVDAGATVITVEIERAGSRLIRITDNGSGMDATDAELCFSPHATSKIKCAEDIERIATLGFRGEALPSIASVSKLLLRTRTAEDPAGIELEMQGGKLIDRRPAGMPVGTIIAVKELFYNVPARKKFLRSPATEEAHIQEMVIALALGFPHVAVTLKFDNKVALQTPGENDPGARAAGLFGKSFANKMIKVEHVEEDITVAGLIAAPGFTRTSRREQRTFVNGRAVESLALYRGIRDGYGTLADFGRFPPTILNVTMDVGDYDINVHPTKREVRFKREYAVSRAVTNAVRSALHQAPAPEIQLPGDRNLARPEILLDASSIIYTPKPTAPAIPGLEQPEHKDIFQAPPRPAAEDIKPSAPVSRLREPKEIPAVPEIPSQQVPIPTAPAAVSSPAAEQVVPAVIQPDNPPEKPADKQERTIQFTDKADHEILQKVIPAAINLPPLARELSDAENLRYIGILFGTFVVLESPANEVMYLVDFHAAHERVLYEKLLQQAQQGKSAPSQQLLLPPAIELSRTAAAFIDKNEQFFQQLGFDAALLSSNTVLLNAIPADFPGDSDWESILTDLVNTALEGEKTTRDSLEAIARAACHSAVKANDPLNETSAQALLKSLSQCERPDVCPHGRPTTLKLTKSELARRFGRI